MAAHFFGNLTEHQLTVAVKSLWGFHLLPDCTGQQKFQEKMVGEPVSAVTATTVTLTSVTFASLLADTPAGVYVGAFSGAVVYVLSSTDMSRFAQVGYFVSSFLLGVVGADFTTAIINELISGWLPADVTVGNWLGATVTAAAGVSILISLRKIDPKALISRLLTGGNDGNAK
ncbi:putative holin [Enterobacter cloacae]|uniref:putative holin n=1 Tax=Enterobacter cloacae TaxID=550 RepID=UPI0034A405D0